MSYAPVLNSMKKGLDPKRRVKASFFFTILTNGFAEIQGSAFLDYEFSLQDI